MELLELVSGGLAVLVFAWTHVRGRARNPNRLPFPPGPKGLPFIGNLIDMPKDKPWLVYDQWAKKYGDMIYFEVLGQPFLILGSLKRTSELFDERSTIYSNRPRMLMLLELMNWGYNMALLPYGSWWRRHRRKFHEHFHTNVVSEYQPTQIREVRRLLERLLETPHDFLRHLRLMFAATIIDISYGIRVADADHPYVVTAEESLHGFAEAGNPGAFLVDLIPFLKYVPSWMPGAGFRRKAARWHAANVDMYQKPWDAVKANLNLGIASPSVASKLMERLPDDNDPRRAEEEEIARDTAAVAFVGGADTTFSTVQSFFLAMAIHPEVQRRAQAELDEVVGQNRLPDFSDVDSLPYINALVKESMRWQQVVPMALYHSSSADDEYDGYFIPKGTIVAGNSWSILHDELVFSQPTEFQPERYLKDGKLNLEVRSPDVAAFGYGRRICPGRHFSNNGLFIVISSVLAVFNIKPPIDAQGKPIQLKPEMTSGLVSFPVAFDCIIEPRSSASEALIHDCQLE